MMFVMVIACMWLVIDMRIGGHLEERERGEGREIYYILWLGLPVLGGVLLHEGAIVDVFYNNSDNIL